MRHLFLIIITIFTALFLVNCSTVKHQQFASNLVKNESITRITKTKYPPKDPRNIALYTPAQKPTTPYRVIGIARVAKSNLIGKRRDEREIKQMMKELAASIGGDAVINLQEINRLLIGHVITFKEITL